MHRAPAVADRRAVRRVRAHAGARGRRGAAAEARADRRRAGRGPVPAAGREHREGGRPRPRSTTSCSGRSASGCRSSWPTSGSASPAAARTSRRSSGAPNPALKEVNEVLKILADQNDVLERLAVDSDTILAPLARERRHVSGAIENSSAVAQATAERRADLEADIERLPEFLRELTPTMVRLGALSDEMTPVLTDLGEVAPDVNRMILELGPFSTRGHPGVRVARRGGRPRHARGDRGAPGRSPTCGGSPRRVRPVGLDARRLLESLQKTGGIQRAMDYVFFQVGRHQRLRLVRPLPARRADRQPVRELLRDAGVRLLVELHAGRRLVGARRPPGRAATRSSRRRRARSPACPRRRTRRTASPSAAATRPRRRRSRPRRRRRRPRRPRRRPTPEPSEQEKTDTLLDYLFGGDG